MEHTAEWAEFSVSVTKEYADPVANFLIEQGSSGIVEEKSPLSQDAVVLKAYVKNDDQMEGFLDRVKTYVESLGALDGAAVIVGDIRVDRIPDEDWNKKWKSFFQPIKVSRRIVIKPSWQSYRKKDGEVIVELDPGMAFGTGTHPSTRVCIEAIDELADTFKEKDASSLLDVGTGSGILAIAAVVLGFKKVTGIDIDRTAIACAVKNAENNAVSQTIFFTADPITKAEGAYDVVVANILPHVLITMKDELVSRLKPHGALILSGILDEKGDEVVAAFSDSAVLCRRLKEEAWTCPVFRKK